MAALPSSSLRRRFRAGVRGRVQPGDHVGLRVVQDPWRRSKGSAGQPPNKAVADTTRVGSTRAYSPFCIAE